MGTWEGRSTCHNIITFSEMIISPGMVVHLPWFCSCVEHISSQWRSVPVALVSVCHSNRGRQSYVASVWMKGSHASLPTDQPFFDTLAPYGSPGSLWQTQCPAGSTEPDV